MGRERLRQQPQLARSARDVNARAAIELAQNPMDMHLDRPRLRLKVAATSRLVRPPATRRATSSSRGESPSRPMTWDTGPNLESSPRTQHAANYCIFRPPLTRASLGKSGALPHRVILTKRLWFHIILPGHQDAASVSIRRSGLSASPSGRRHRTRSGSGSRQTLVRRRPARPRQRSA
jgi:hypothetical protein